MNNNRTNGNNTKYHHENQKSENIDCKMVDNKSLKPRKKHSNNPQDQQATSAQINTNHHNHNDETTTTSITMTEIDKNNIKKNENRRMKKNHHHNNGIENVNVDHNKGGVSNKHHHRRFRNKENFTKPRQQNHHPIPKDDTKNHELQETLSKESNSVIDNEDRTPVENTRDFREKKSKKYYGRKKNRCIDQGQHAHHNHHGGGGASNEIPFQHEKNFRHQKQHWKNKKELKELVIYGKKITPSPINEANGTEQVTAIGIGEESQRCQEPVVSYFYQSTNSAGKKMIGIKSSAAVPQDIPFSDTSVSPHSNFTHEKEAASLRTSKEKEIATCVIDSKNVHISSPLINEQIQQNLQVTPLKYSEAQTIDPSISSAMMYQSHYPPVYDSYHYQLPAPIYSDPNVPYIYPVVPHDIPYDFMGGYNQHQHGYFVPYCQPQVIYYNEPLSPIFCNTQNPPIVECNNKIESQISGKEEGLPIEKKSLNVQAKEWNGSVGKPLQ